MLRLFELNANYIDSYTYPSSNNTGNITVNRYEEVNRFEKDIKITINHTPEELRGLDVDSLCLYYLDEDSKRWPFSPKSAYHLIG